MALLFRLLVTLAVLLAAVICEGQQEVVLQDAFNPDLQRTWNLSQPETAAVWCLEQKIPAALGKLFCRFCRHRTLAAAAAVVEPRGAGSPESYNFHYSAAAAPAVAERG